MDFSLRERGIKKPKNGVRHAIDDNSGLHHCSSEDGEKLKESKLFK